MEGNACILCGNTGTNCKYCQKNIGFCDACNDGFLVGDNSACLACPLGCKTCVSDINSNRCSSCFDGNLFNPITNSCAACSDVCSTCSTVYKCTLCKKNHYLEGEVCILCGQLGTDCNACSPTLGFCDMCNDGFLYLNQMEDAYLVPLDVKPALQVLILILACLVWKAIFLALIQLAVLHVLIVVPNVPQPINALHANNSIL